jgi:hypothetical protein
MLNVLDILLFPLVLNVRVSYLPKKVKENKHIKYIVYAIITDRDWPFISL